MSYVVNQMQKKNVHTNRYRYREICEALDYGDEYFMETKQLHSSSPLSPDLSAGGSGDVSSNSRRGSCPSASQARSQANTGTSSLHQQATSPTNTGTSNPHEQATSSASTGTPSLHQPKSVDEAPSNYPFSASYLQDMSLRRKQLHQDDSTDDAAGSDPPTSQNVAPQIIKRLVPDRSAKPLGDPDVARRRKKPAEVTSSSISSGSLGESAPGTESAKRPLPESPTSALQPASSSRRRQDVQETSSREETSPSSRRPDKKGSKDQRGRA